MCKDVLRLIETKINKLINMLSIITYRTYKVTLLVGLLFMNIQLFAQDSKVTIDDPLKKPPIWEQLKKSPYNDALWTSYFEQDLFSLTREQYISYNEWKAYLVELKSKEIEAKELELLKRREEYLAKRYSHKRKLTESDFDELVQNVSKNFPIIEQYFYEQFEALGEKYELYVEAHPEKKYNQTRWVEEHEEKLLNLKMND